MKWHPVTILLAACVAGAGSAAVAASDLKDGDIVFQTSSSRQSKAIQLATHSPYSHMGILFREDGRWMVYEAVQPVKRTPLQQWMDRGISGSDIVKRLKNRERYLSGQKAADLRKATRRYLGKPYDRAFGWSDDRIYCSALVWKSYKSATGLELGSLKQLRAFDLSSPDVQQGLHERYGEKVPLDEPVISPADIFESPLLETLR